MDTRNDKEYRPQAGPKTHKFAIGNLLRNSPFGYVICTSFDGMWDVISGQTGAGDLKLGRQFLEPGILRARELQMVSIRK